MKQLILDKFLEVFGDLEGTTVYFAPGRVNMIGTISDIKYKAYI